MEKEKFNTYLLNFRDGSIYFIKTMLKHEEMQKEISTKEFSFVEYLIARKTTIAKVTGESNFAYIRNSDVIAIEIMSNIEINE